jgi:formylglycine-generating enzyme
MISAYKYDVAISFAEEDRNAALALSLALELEGLLNIYYYPDQRTAGWGQDPDEMLTNIYSKEARYAVVLFSANYFDPQKRYTKIEFAAIESRVKHEAPYVYMLPVILGTEADCAEYPAVDKLWYLEWNYNPKGIASSLRELFGKDFKTVRDKMKFTTVFNVSGDDTIIINRSRVNNVNKNKIPNDRR